MWVGGSLLLLRWVCVAQVAGSLVELLGAAREGPASQSTASMQGWQRAVLAPMVQVSGASAPPGALGRTARGVGNAAAVLGRLTPCLRKTWRACHW